MTDEHESRGLPPNATADRPEPKFIDCSLAGPLAGRVRLRRKVELVTRGGDNEPEKPKPGEKTV